MMAFAVPPSASRLMSALWPATWKVLARLGVREGELPAELASATGSGGRIRLQAARWQVERHGECRMVAIHGTNMEVLNTMLFPTYPGRLPLFAAELLVIGGQPRLAFVDLQTPGMVVEPRRHIVDVTRTIVRRLAALPVSRLPPTWAMASSSGYPFFVEHLDPNHFPMIQEAYLRYLEAWLETAMQQSTDDAIDPAACEALQEYKRHHVAHSPGRGFLEKLFTPAWTERFLTQFLYA